MSVQVTQTSDHVNEKGNLVVPGSHEDATSRVMSIILLLGGIAFVVLE